MNATEISAEDVLRIVNERIEYVIVCEQESSPELQSLWRAQRTALLDLRAAAYGIDGTDDWLR